MPVQLSYGYDGGGRVNVITSSLDSNANYPATLFSATSSAASGCGGSSLSPYNGADQLQYAQLAGSGAQAPLSITRCYDSRLRLTSETDAGQDATAAVAASTTVTVSGAEQSIGSSGTPTQATGTISLSYSGAQVMGPRPDYASDSITLPGGYHTSFIATANSAVTVANAIASVLNQASSPVTAVVSSGGTASAASVVLITKATGADENGAITLSLAATKVTAAPALLSGGAGTTYDTGSVTANVNGTAVTASYGQPSTTHTVAHSAGSSHQRVGGRGNGHRGHGRIHHGDRQPGGNNRQWPDG